MRRFLLLASLALLAGYLLTGVTQVQPGERAVVRRFGRVLDEKPRPGLWVGLPWGMDRVDRVAVHQVRRVEVGYDPEQETEPTVAPPGQLLTGDHNLVNVRVAVDYTVNEDAVVDYVLHAGQADELLTRAAEAALADWVAGQRVDGVLLTRKAELAEALRRRTQATVAAYRLGVAVQDASVVSLAPPEDVRPAFDEVTRAQAEIRTRENEARQAAARQLNDARALKYQTEQEAAAYVHERLKLAEAEAASFEVRRHELEKQGPGRAAYLAAVWWKEMGALFAKLKADGRLDLLDSRLGGEGVDLTTVVPPPNKK